MTIYMKLGFVIYLQDNCYCFKLFSFLFLFSVPTNLLTLEQQTLIGSWLEESSGLGKYELCWSSSNDGNSFHSKCDGKPHTITIAKLRYGNSIYGGYTDVAWNRKLPVVSIK